MGGRRSGRPYPLDLILAAMASGALGVLIGRSFSPEPRFLVLVTTACTAASCGLAAAAGGRFASRRGGPFAAKVLIAVLMVAGFASSAVVAGAGQVLAASSVLVASAVLVSRGLAGSRGAFALVVVAALALGLVDRYGPSGRLALPASRFPSIPVATAALVWMAGLCLLARLSARTAVTLALLSTTAAGWALSVRQGDGDAGWAGLLCGLVLSMTALSLVVLSAESGERNLPGVPHRDASGLAAAAAHTTDEDEVRALVNSARVLMWLSDPEGRRTYLNHSWLEFTGRTMEDERGNGWTAGVHPDDARRLAHRGEAIRGDVKAFETEYRLRRFDGEYHWMLERGQPWVGPDGGLLGYVGSCIDISERKLREAALQEERSQLAQKVEERTSELARANAELAKAARLKDDFLANVSHELRTPLTAILGLSEALLGEAQGPLTPKQNKALLTIEASGQHLLSLINELLDLARIEAGHMAIDKREGVSVEAVCEGSLRFIREAAQKKGVTLSCTVDRSFATLECDERRLKQVLINLLGNAVKFTASGGAVGIEAVGDASENVARFTVWDTGIGMRKEDMGRLFQPFVQIDGSRTRQHGGTGLGLALSRRIVELHGGQVMAGSEPGKGSRFTVALPWKSGRLPASPARPAVAAPDDPPPSPLEREIPGGIATPCRILVVEDNPDLAGMLADHLEGRGHRVLSARTGADAIDVAVQQRPDLILMDVEMPETDGLEAMRRIRAHDGLETTPILALTALAMPGDRERCRDAGATDYMSKPLNLGSLSAWIDRWGKSR